MDISKKEIAALIGSWISMPVILDIGSYDGKDAAELTEHFNGCEIHCFEADPRSQELWKDFNGFNRDMILYHTAIGNIDAPIKFYQSSSKTRNHYPGKQWSASSSMLQPKTHIELFPDVKFENEVKVMCFKLDTWAERVLAGRTVDFIWCDVNGAEQMVIEGASETLKRTRYLYIEFSDKELYEGQITKQQLLDMLPDFEVQGEYNFEGNFGNILCKNKNL